MEYPISYNGNGHEALDAPEKPVKFINFKRVLAKALQFWYLIIVSVAIALTIAFVINRYTTRIYPITASIIVREGDENAGAKFLYNNSLVNPYRNYFNELYIMRSYPLLQQVVEQLNFSVAWYKEGNIKSTEFYYPQFPVKIHVLPSAQMPYGRTMGITMLDENSFTLEYLSDDEEKHGEAFKSLQYNDTISVNGYKFFVEKRGMLGPNLAGNYYVIKFTHPFSLARMYAGRLRATWAELGASVVNLSIEGAVPEKEIDFIQKFIERYQQYDIDKKNQVATKSIEFLDRQLANMRDSLDYFDDKIKSFKQTYFLTNLDAESQRLYARIEGLESQKSQMILFDNYARYMDQYINESDDYDQIVPPSAVGLTDPILTGLVKQLTDLQSGIRLMGDKLNDNNPIVIEQRAKIRQLKKDIREGMNSIRSTQKINRSFLDKQIRELESGLTKLPESDRLLVSIKRNYTLRENLYVFLMQKRAEAGISRASTTSDIIVVNPPIQSGGAITPKPLQNYSIALFTGLLIPFMFFVGSELLNTRIQSKEDIEQYTTIPIIGGVGHNNFVDNSLVVMNKPKSAMAESFRALRSNLNYFTQGKDKRIILITSSISGEGKTFTTINLASVLALTGKKVLIIGADMRKPKIFSDLGLHNKIGLSSLLSSMATLKEVIQHSSIENLDLISGGPVPPNPGELLLRPEVATIMETILLEYDYVILDTPPIGLVADAFALLPYAHHTIFMVRQNYTPREFLTNLQEKFDQGEMTNVSILFNDIRRTGPGYGYGNAYGYGYGYAYGYGYGYYGKKKRKTAESYYTE